MAYWMHLGKTSCKASEKEASEWKYLGEGCRYVYELGVPGWPESLTEALYRTLQNTVCTLSGIGRAAFPHKNCEAKLCDCLWSVLKGQI